MAKSTHIRHWGLFMLLAGLLFALQELIKLPDWLSTPLFVLGWWFVVQPLAGTSPGRKGFGCRPIYEIFLMSVVVIAASVCSTWLRQFFDLGVNYTLALVFGGLGLLLLIGSLLLRGKSASDGEKPSLV